MRRLSRRHVETGFPSRRPGLNRHCFAAFTASSSRPCSLSSDFHHLHVAHGPVRSDDTFHRHGTLEFLGAAIRRVPGPHLADYGRIDNPRDFLDPLPHQGAEDPHVGERRRTGGCDNPEAVGEEKIMTSLSGAATFDL